MQMLFASVSYHARSCGFEEYQTKLILDFLAQNYKKTSISSSPGILELRTIAAAGKVYRMVSSVLEVGYQKVDQAKLRNITP